jgi:hypothetical protein
MYHELELPGRKLCQSEPGYVRYILSLEAFRGQMAWLKEQGWRGLMRERGSGFFMNSAQPSVCITFRRWLRDRPDRCRSHTSRVWIFMPRST